MLRAEALSDLSIDVCIAPQASMHARILCHLLDEIIESSLTFS